MEVKQEGVRGGEREEGGEVGWMVSKIKIKINW